MKLALLFVIMLFDSELFAMDHSKVNIDSNLIQDNIQIIMQNDLNYNFENLNNDVSLFGFQSQLRQNNILLRGIDSKFLNISLDGINMMNMNNGNFDYSVLTDLILQNNQSTFIPSADKNDFSNISVFSPSYSNNIFKSSIFASNQFGYVNIAKAHKIKNFKYYIAGDYTTMPEFNISNENDAIFGVSKGSRINSKFDQFNLFGKLRLDDNLSSISLTYLLNNTKKDIPSNIYGKDSIYKDINKQILNFITLDFKTDLGINEYINVNLFFINKTSNVNLYTDSNLTIRNPNSNYNNFSSNSYGLNLLMNFDSETSFIDRIGFEYRRNETKFDYLLYQAPIPINDEQIKLNIGKSIIPSKLKNIIINFKLEYYLERYQNLSLSTDSRFSGINIYMNSSYQYNNKSVNLNVAYYGKSPSLDIFLNDDGRIPVKESKGFLAELVFDKVINTNNYQFNSTLFTFLGNNLSTNKSLMSEKNTELFDYNSLGIEINNLMKFDKLLIEINYLYCNLSKPTNLANLNYLFAPEHSFRSNAIYSFDFGLNLKVSLDYYNERNNYVKGSLKVLNSFYLLNLNLSQKLFDKNYFFIKINNLLDRYYEHVYGFPGSGILYGMGVNFEF